MKEISGPDGSTPGLRGKIYRTLDRIQARGENKRWAKWLSNVGQAGQNVVPPNSAPPP